MQRTVQSLQLLLKEQSGKKSFSLKGQCHKIFEIFMFAKIFPCQCSQWLRWHTGSYFTLEKVKKKKKKCYLIFSKIACLRSHWLCLYCVGVVVDYADTILALSMTMQIRFWRSQQLWGHDVSVVNDFSDTVSA